MHYLPCFFNHTTQKILVSPELKTHLKQLQYAELISQCLCRKAKPGNVKGLQKKKKTVSVIFKHSINKLNTTENLPMHRHCISNTPKSPLCASFVPATIPNLTWLNRFAGPCFRIETSHPFVPVN